MLIGATALALTVIGDSFYRPWIYDNNYFDFGLANYLPSITGTITAIFILCGQSKSFPKNIIQSSCGVIIGCASYEILQPIFHTGVFDWQDISAIFITGTIVILYFKALLKKPVHNAESKI